jgi:NAD-dependent dihydropyrimidine dehydrogenase PreA subunit
MERQIITINEDKCTGCGLCVPDCPEGALQIIDGKARLIGDLYCDGLGACLGRCPEGAIEIETREAEDYDEFAVMANVEKQGPNVIKAHLHHLHSHGADTFYRQACQYLVEHGYDLAEFVVDGKPVNLAAARTGGASGSPASPALAGLKQHQPAAGAGHSHPHGHEHHGHGGHEGACPGSRAMSFGSGAAAAPPAAAGGDIPSALGQWPIQMHLFNPRSPHFAGCDFLLAADCTAFALGAFHPRLLAGKKLGIACPKLDSNQEIYRDKLVALIDEARINTLTVAIMEVPCCGGLSALAQQAAAMAKRKIPIKEVVVGIEGGIQSEEWL